VMAAGRHSGDQNIHTAWETKRSPINRWTKASITTLNPGLIGSTVQQEERCTIPPFVNSDRKRALGGASAGPSRGQLSLQARVE
jgi:hypothetical protein